MTRRSKKMITQSRDDIAKFLPDALAKAFRSYHEFMEQDVPEDAKGFGAHHTAAKVAIAHIELLMKLASIANLMDSDDHPEIAGIMQSAEEEYKKIAEDINDEESDGEDND